MRSTFSLFSAKDCWYSVLISSMDAKTVPFSLLREDAVAIENIDIRDVPTPDSNYLTVA